MAAAFHRERANELLSAPEGKDSRCRICGEPSDNADLFGYVVCESCLMKPWPHIAEDLPDHLRVVPEFDLGYAAAIADIARGLDASCPNTEGNDKWAERLAKIGAEARNHE